MSTQNCGMDWVSTVCAIPNPGDDMSLVKRDA